MLARRILALSVLSALATGCLNEVETTPPGERTPVLLPSVAELAFAARTDQGNPAAKTVTVLNGGGGTLAKPGATVTTADGAGWLTAEVSGTEVPYTVTVQVARGALTAGTYTGEVVLESPGARRPRTIAVTYVLRDPVPATMVLSDSTLSFAALASGASPAAQAVTVTNGGDLALGVPAAAVNYGGSATTGWLSADVTGAAPPYTVTVQATTGSLAAGTYTASVDLTATGAAPVSIAVTFTVSPPRTVTVTRFVTFWTEAGAGTPVLDPSVLKVALKQDDGAGGLNSVDATQVTPGTWTAVIGPGQYWAAITWTTGEQTWVRASADALDLGEDLAGRGDRTLATQATNATLGLTALVPWDRLNDALFLVSYDAQVVALLSGSTTPPLDIADGADAISGFTFDWAQVGKTLLAATDQLWLLQSTFRANTDANLFYAITRTWSGLTGVAMADGAPVSLAAPPSDVPGPQGSLLLDWRRSRFETALPPSTSTSATAHNVAVVALPVPLQSPSPFGAVAVPLLETFRAPTTARDPDFSAGTLSYGRFLPAAWNEVFLAQYGVDVSRTAPGATAAAPGLKDLVFRNDAIGAAPNPVVPLVGGPIPPTIDGADILAAARTGVSTTPTLAWAAPATGTASAYVVEVQRLAANGAASEVTLVAQFVLTGTSLAIPPGLLQPGQTYLLRLVARRNPADVGGATPFRRGVPFGEASYWTQPFTTAP